MTKNAEKKSRILGENRVTHARSAQNIFVVMTNFVSTLLVATRTRPPSSKASSSSSSSSSSTSAEKLDRDKAKKKKSNKSSGCAGTTALATCDGTEERLRQLLDTDADRKVVRISNPLPASSTKKAKEYKFDAVFDRHSTNEQVYRDVFLRSSSSSSSSSSKEEANEEDLNVVDTILRGGIATVFAYGATGSGKTHTMVGKRDDPGMMMRSIRDVFDGVGRMNEERKRKTREGRCAGTENIDDEEEEEEEEEEGRKGTLEVRCSYVEVYNENLFDLLAEKTTAIPQQNNHQQQQSSNKGEFDLSASLSSSLGVFGSSDLRQSRNSFSNGGVAASSQPKLELREDPSRGGAVVVGAKEIVVCSPSHVSDLLEKGNSRRKTDATDINATSSRSHAVLEIVVCERINNDCHDDKKDECVIKRGKLSLVDLAGSERANEANTRGDKLRDGASINKSLLALANCINALGRRKKVSDTQQKNASTATRRSVVHHNLHHHSHVASPKVSSQRKPTTTVYVPYRDSKLTRLLKDGLSGKGKCVMIATVSEDAEQAINNANTLSYANRAKSIEMINPSHSSISTESYHIAEMKKNGEYRKVVEALQSEVSRLKLALGNALENNNNNNNNNNNDKSVTAESTSSTTSSRLQGFFSRRNTTKSTSMLSINDDTVTSSAMTDSIPFGRSKFYNNNKTLSIGGKYAAVAHDECKTCSSRIALDERVLQLCDEITENVEERVNFQKALFELEAADMSNRRALAKRQKRVAIARGEEKTKQEKKIAKLRQQHLRHAEDSKKYADEISRNDSVRDLISKKVDDLISGGGNYRGNIGLARSLSEYRLAVARNAELQFALALRDQTVAELREEIESLCDRKTSNSFTSSMPAANIGDVDDNSSISSFDDDEEDDDEESERGSTISTHKRSGSKIPNIASLFSEDGFDEDDDAWGNHQHHRSARKSTPTATSVHIAELELRAAPGASSPPSSHAKDASSPSTSSKVSPGSKSSAEQNANSLSARRRALAIERAALKAGNLSARGASARSASAIPSSSKYGDMIRDASLIFNRNKIVETTSSSKSLAMSNTMSVPKGSAKFNETRDRFRRKFG